MDEDKLAQLRDHYGTADLPAEIERAHWETDVEPDPMVTTSLRLPKSVLDWVRQQAEAEHVKPTALIRRWVEEQRAGRTPDVGGRLERLVERLEVAVAAEEKVSRPVSGIRNVRRAKVPVAAAHLAKLREARARTRSGGLGRPSPEGEGSG